MKLLGKNHGDVCQVKLKIQPGKSFNDSAKPKIIGLPEKMKKLAGQGAFLVRVYAKLDREKRVWLTGEIGIGKSAIAMKLSHLLFDRGIYPDGVLYISLQH